MKSSNIFREENLMSIEMIKCPACGAENPAKRLECFNCGEPFRLMQCPKCGKSNSVRREDCFECGAMLYPDKHEATSQTHDAAIISANQTPSSEKANYDTSQVLLENTSGQGISAEIPNEIQRWNWGAFWLTWIWGLAHNVWVSLVVLIPGAVLIMPFILGAKGTEWGWQNRKFKGGIAEFRKVQRRWALWGWIIAPILITILFLPLLIPVAHTHFMRPKTLVTSRTPELAQVEKAVQEHMERHGLPERSRGNSK
jgi:hypothetical protein